MPAVRGWGGEYSPASPDEQAFSGAGCGFYFGTRVALSEVASIAAGKITVKHADGTTDVTVDQRRNGDRWNLLGTFTFEAGKLDGVTISNDIGEKELIAVDAFKWSPAADPPAPTTAASADR